MKLSPIVWILMLSTVAAANPHVVIDPGHGGSNHGAKGVAVEEKQLTWTIANLVATRLRAKSIDVDFTRDGDQTKTLRQRIVTANTKHADAFLSIHANASPNRAQRGFETWVLSARAVDVDSPALRTGVTAPRAGLDPDVSLVVDDVERRAAQWEAADLATRVQANLRDLRGEANDRGVRQEAHHVLLGAMMPAVLVEVGFVDHPLEGKELAEPALQARIADALANAVIDQLAKP